MTIEYHHHPRNTPVTIDDLRAIAKGDLIFDDDLDSDEPAQIMVDAYDGDMDAQLTIAIALADDLLDKYETDLQGGRWSSYVIYSLGWGRLPDGREVKPGAILYAGRTKDISHREKLHRQEAQRAEPRSPIAAAIKELRDQGQEVFLHPVAENLAIEDAKKAEASLIRSLAKAGHPLQNRQLNGKEGPMD
jgi:hypothetical protein